MNIELGSYGNEDETIGILQINIQGLPAINQRKMVNEKVLLNILTTEKEVDTYQLNDFYKYAKNWWNTYKQKYGKASKRLIKICVENEFGYFIPLSCFVRPLHNVKGIDNARSAARFVSLIPFKKF